jgi:AraC-like DNA-binding protein
MRTRASWVADARTQCERVTRRSAQRTHHSLGDDRKRLLDFVSACQVVAGDMLDDADTALPKLRAMAAAIPSVQDPFVARELRNVVLGFVIELIRHLHVATNHLSSRDLAEIGHAITTGNPRDAIGTLLNRLDAQRPSQAAHPGVAAALAFINAHCQDSTIRLADVARHVKLSSCHLDRLLVRERHAGFAHILRGCRLAHARHLLVTSDASVKEIAFAVGYRHANQLSRHFRALYGTTPSSWRLTARSVRR